MQVLTEDIDAKGGAVDAWQDLQQDSWKTAAVSWSYSQDQLPKSRSPFVCAKPPHYRHSLFHIPSSYYDSTSSDPQQLELEGDDLNPDLVGVKVAEDALQKYEIDVGFYYADQLYRKVDLVSSQDNPPSTPSQGCLRGQVDEEEVMLNRERWHDLVEGLTYGILDGVSSPSSSAGLHRSTSTLSSIDLSDSERSVISNSMPSTPKAKTSYPNVVVKGQSPASSDSDHLCHHRRIASRLNASASSFTPTSMTPEKPRSSPFHLPPSPSTASMSSPTSTDFTFPSLNSRASSTHSQSPPSVVLEKDVNAFHKEAGFSLFHGSVSSSKQPFFAQVPSFLTNQPRRKLSSKTRTIVDGLRVSGGIANRIKSAGPSPSPSPSDPAFSSLDLGFLKPRLSVSEDGGDLRSSDEDSDGWIRPVLNEGGSEQRTRDPYLALGRNRPGSRAGEEKEEGKDDVDLGYQFLNERSALYSQASSLPPKVDPEVTSNDGWIEGPLTCASRPRKLRSGNPSPSIPFPSLSPHAAVNLQKPQPRFTATPFIPVLHPPSYFAVPVMYSSYAHPHATTTGYTQMQMHLQSQLHLQMQMQAHSHHPWFQSAYPLLPLIPASSHPGAPRFANSDGANVTGVSGMRHMG